MDQRKLALIGSNGMLALKVCEQASAAGYEVVGFDLPDFDITNWGQVLSEMERVQPAIIINCAAYTNVDGCESQETLATLVNGAGAGNLAHVARSLGATLVHISTDYVFDGNKTGPYLEEDATGPQSAYGRSKLAGERAIAESGLEEFFIIRTSWLYGPGGKNFVETILCLATERDELRIVADQVGSPTYTGDLAAAIFTLLALNASCQLPAPSNGDSPHAGTVPYGVYHFSDEGQCSWYEFAQEIIRLAKERGEAIKINTVRPIATHEYPLPARRPVYSVFSKDKFKSVTGTAIPHWRESLAVYMDSRKN